MPRDPADKERSYDRDDENKDRRTQREHQYSAYAEGRDCGENPGHLVGEPVSGGRVTAAHSRHFQPCRLDPLAVYARMEKESVYN
jgi:hypothetical protein